MNATHALSQAFMEALLHGVLSPIREVVKDDATLHLGIRSEYLTIYYRGGQLIKINRKIDSYIIYFDGNYDPNGLMSSILPLEIKSADDAEAVVQALGALKGLMDVHPKIKSGVEREFQQVVARVNNRSRSAKSSHYFITDLEHAAGNARFDMLGVRWHHSERKKGDCLVPAIFEMKYGEGHLTGKAASMEQHLRDALDYILSAGGLDTLRANIESQFTQLLELDLIAYTPSKSIQRFSMTRDVVQVVFVIAEYPPHSTQLHRLLDALEAALHERRSALDALGIDVQLRFAGASLCGYAMYDETMLSVPDLRERLCDWNSKLPRLSAEDDG